MGRSHGALRGRFVFFWITSSWNIFMKLFCFLWLFAFLRAWLLLLELWISQWRGAFKFLNQKTPSTTQSPVGRLLVMLYARSDRLTDMPITLHESEYPSLDGIASVQRRACVPVRGTVPDLFSAVDTHSDFFRLTQTCSDFLIRTHTYSYLLKLTHTYSYLLVRTHGLEKSSPQ